MTKSLLCNFTACVLVALALVQCGGTEMLAVGDVVAQTGAKQNSAGSVKAIPATETPPSIAAPITMLPVDEAARDNDFLTHRTALLRAIRDRDLVAVVAAAAPDIHLDFGGGFGSEQFRQQLVNDQDGSRYWRELETAIALGGVFETPDDFCSPYVFCLDIPGCSDCDPFTTLVAVSQGSVIHAAPDGNSQVVATLAYGVVTVDDQGTHYPWFEVRLAGDSANKDLGANLGFVDSSSDFRSPVDYRANFRKQADGTWLMVSFIAGD